MRTIFLYGYGTGLEGRQPWWDAPWIEPPWLDGGRLEFRRDHAPSVENLYHEAAAIAQIDGLAPVIRGTQDAGFASLSLFRRVVEAHTYPFTEKGQVPPTFSPFVDTGCFGDVVSVAAGHDVSFDFADATHRELIWKTVLGPFFEVFDERTPTSAVNPIRHERTSSGRRLVTFWKIAPEVCKQRLVNQDKAQLLLNLIAGRMQDAGLGEPDFIVDTTWPSNISAYGMHDWYRPERGESWTAFKRGSVVTGVAVPGFHDPPWSSVSPARIVSRRNGATLREAFAGWRAAGAAYGFLESLTNIEESAGFYRSPLWGDLYLQIVREHIHDGRTG